jgi:glycosyltransferase involved in cell wall biosynthesis
MIEENDIEITVSICCLAFNHEAYISQTLEGFVSQKVDFNYEVIVHDDCSKDSTRSIILEYQNKYPLLIKTVFQEVNQYSQGKKPIFTDVFPKARGKYIALCEGDDYWTDPKKLSKQVELLERNKGCVLCFHDVQILMENGELKNDHLANPPEQELNLHTVARFGNFIHTPSILFRNILGQVDPKLLQTAVGDFLLQMLIAEKGNFIKAPGVMAVYRYGVGAWSTEGEYKRRLGTAKTHLVIAEYYHQRNHPEVVDILLKRVNRFLREQQHKISSADLDYLLNGCAIKEEFLKNIWSSLEAKDARIEILKGNQLQSTPISGLVKEAFSRIKNRLLK